MRRRIVSVLITIAATLTFCLKAKAESQPELIPMHATAYCLPGITATGKEVRVGICATGRRELMGKTCIVYQRLPDGSIGEMLYILEIEDCGCSKNVIDIWQPDLGACQGVMDKLYERGCQGRIYCQILEDCNG